MRFWGGYKSGWWRLGEGKRRLGRKMGGGGAHLSSNSLYPSPRALPTTSALAHPSGAGPPSCKAESPKGPPTANRGGQQQSNTSFTDSHADNNTTHPNESSEANRFAAARTRGQTATGAAQTATVGDVKTPAEQCARAPPTEGTC